MTVHEILQPPDFDTPCPRTKTLCTEGLRYGLTLNIAARLNSSHRESARVASLRHRSADDTRRASLGKVKKIAKALNIPIIGDGRDEGGRNTLVNPPSIKTEVRTG